jgi:hypothetical protein
MASTSLTSPAGSINSGVPQTTLTGFVFIEGY